MIRFVPLLALTLFAAPALAQQRAPLPPLMPWSGASERLIAPADHPWITPAERAGFDTTPNAADTRAWLERLAAASPLITLHEFGRSAEGRVLYYVRASTGPARNGGPKPLVLAQGGIHGGEIDGKDAGMMLLRDTAFRGKQGLLADADLVLVPIFNVDGHERSSEWNRPNQRGPRAMGWRTTARNQNLNRDYLKADTPEMRAMLALLRQLDPVLYLDLHVTDGSDHQYDVAYAFAGWRGFYARSPAIGRWMDTRMRPAIDRALTAAGHTPGIYVSASDGRDPTRGIDQNADTPRFSTGWGDLARVPTVLIETHSLKPYRQRVLGTYVLVEEALRLAGAEGTRIRAAIERDRASRPREMVMRWQPAPGPLYTVRFKGMASETYRSPASGRDEIRFLGRPITTDTPVNGQIPALTNRLPRAWWIPAAEAEAIARLDAQGIRYETLAKARTLDLDVTRLSNVKLANANEGRVPLTADFTHVREQVTMPAGSVRVPADQPLALLAAAMFEPESPDSLLAWNFFPGILTRTEYIEGYAIAPLADAMLAADPALRREFEAKLAAEPAFAADGAARLAWFYQRTPYYDQRHLRYPIGREL